MLWPSFGIGMPVWQDAQRELSNLKQLMDQHDERLSTLREESAQYQEDLSGSRCFAACVLHQFSQAKNQYCLDTTLLCQAHVSHPTLQRNDRRYSNTKSTSCISYEIFARLWISMSDAFQATQKERNRLQMLIGQHDEQLSTLHEERAQEKEDNPGNSSVAALWRWCCLANSRIICCSTSICRSFSALCFIFLSLCFSDAFQWMTQCLAAYSSIWRTWIRHPNSAQNIPAPIPKNIVPFFIIFVGQHYCHAMPCCDRIVRPDVPHRTLKVSSATCRSWWTSMMSGWAPCEKSLLKVRRTLLGVVASQSALLSTQLRINSLVGTALCCHAHVSQSTAKYCNTLRKEPTTCFWYEATGWLIVPVLDDVQGTQKELNSLQMLIGQHDERLSTLQKESVQYQKDVPGSH